MSFTGKLARGLLQGAANYYGLKAHEQSEERKMRILADRQMALENAKAQHEAARAQRDHNYNLDRDEHQNDLGIQRDDAKSVLSQAEREAQKLGYEEGSNDWKRYVKDRTLAARGPTATELAESRIETTRRGQDFAQKRYESRPKPQPKSSKPSKSGVIGQLIEKQASGQALTPAEQETLRTYGGGKSPLPEGTIIDLPDGTSQIIRNGKPVRHDG